MRQTGFIVGIVFIFTLSGCGKDGALRDREIVNAPVSNIIVVNDIAYEAGTDNVLHDIK